MTWDQDFEQREEETSIDHHYYVKYLVFPECIDKVESIKEQILNIVDPLTKDYLWNQDSFIIGSSKDGSRLEGKVVFGDCMEDEWFVTFLLFEISKVMPDIVISVSDADGQYLLIEAAEHLPDWLEPETSLNRVFIYRGSLHIIDLHDISSPSLKEALDFIQKRPEVTCASRPIQQAIQVRTNMFKQGQQKHHARGILPKRLAIAIQSRYFCVADILKALFDREPMDISKASLFKHFLRSKDTIEDLDLVPIKLAFTKNQFAKLLCTQLHPPKWYPMPAEQSSDYLACSLGLKLLFGAEILFQQDQASFTSFLHGEKNYDPPVVYNGPDDSLDWLNINDGLLINEIESTFRGITLSPEEQDQVVEKMTNEEIGSKKASPLQAHLDEFLNAASGFDGITHDKEEEDDDDDDASDITDYSQEEFDDDLLEREILETVLHDPDLLMKIIGRGDEFGLDVSELVNKIRNFKDQKVEPETKKSQKGLADIDPIKLAFAKKSPTHRAATKDAPLTESSASEIDEEDINEYIYSKDEKPLQNQNVQYVSSDSEVEEGEQGKKKSSLHDQPTSSARPKPRISDYMAAMDAELALTAASRTVSDKVTIENFKESTRADNSPAHSILLSMKK